MPKTNTYDLIAKVVLPESHSLLSTNPWVANFTGHANSSGTFLALYEENLK